jgi:hypothetical protein
VCSAVRAFQSEQKATSAATLPSFRSYYTYVQLSADCSMIANGTRATTSK